jgi:prolyl-tRNA synthetase
MRWSESLIPTLKEDPQDAEVVSHKLMIRGGYVRKLISGVYTYLPLGLRVLEKVEKIIREEMDAKGSQEVFLCSMNPPELWRKTGRYDLLGDILIKFKDRHGKELILGPTHEEVITDLVANNVRSYKELPLILYQIQTKFRDEPRPRFGIMRTSEFIMKDAYSFDSDAAGLEESYKKMYEAYCRIFTRCGLPYIAVEADPGMMGGSISHEFMVPSEAGEDNIVVCSKCKYAASVDVAGCKSKTKTASKEKALPIAQVDTPDITTIEKVSALLKAGPERLVKTLIYIADGSPVAILIRGDYEANETKIKNYLKAAVLELADAKTIEELTRAPVGFSGPISIGNIRIIADNAIRHMTNFIVGANRKDAHLINVNIGRDFEVKEFADLRMITKDDGCPICGRPVDIKHAIEVGHTFKLGTKYSDALDAKVLDKDGKEIAVIMGCYGIGVTRILASIIESNNDKDGMIWPLSVAPYHAVIIALNMDDKKVKESSENIYKRLSGAGVEVLFDDRDETAGVKFKDADLIGIPIKIIVGAKNAKKGIVEIKDRRTGAVEEVCHKDIEQHLRSWLKKAVTGEA